MLFNAVFEIYEIENLCFVGTLRIVSLMGLNFRFWWWKFVCSKVMYCFYGCI